jgi:hypothetical protein
MDTKREQIMEFLETLPTPIDVLSLVDIVPIIYARFNGANTVLPVVV